MKKLLFAFAACLLITSPVVAGEMLRVELKSGQVLVGERDSRSSQTQLIVRHRLGSTVRLQAIPAVQIAVVRPVAVAAPYPTVSQQAKRAQQLLHDETLGLKK